MLCFAAVVVPCYLCDNRRKQRVYICASVTEKKLHIAKLKQTLKKKTESEQSNLYPDFTNLLLTELSPKKRMQKRVFKNLDNSTCSAMKRLKIA